MNLIEIVHKLVDGAIHLNANEKGEMHDHLDRLADEALGKAEQTAATEVISSSYDRSNPVDRAAERAELEKELADLNALDAPATVPADDNPAVVKGGE